MDEVTDNAKRKNEYGCTLSINTLDDHPQIITEQIGLEASKLIVKGSPWLSPITKKVIEGKYQDQNLWIYNIGGVYSSSNLYLNSPLEKMLGVIDSRKETFLDIFKRYDLKNLLCYAYFYEVNPFFQLDSRIVETLGVYRIGLTFDIYCLAQ